MLSHCQLVDCDEVLAVASASGGFDFSSSV